MIKAGIIGATGYAGGELVRILTGHRDVEICWYGSRSYIDKKYADVYQNMFQIVDAKCLDDNMEELAKIRAEVLVSRTVTRVLTEQFQKDTYKDELFTVTKDDEGNMSMVQADSAKINLLMSQISARLPESFQNRKKEEFSVPAGALLGSRFLSQTGPQVGITVIPLSVSAMDFKTEFETQGINQTKYKIYIVLTCRIKMAAPFSTRVFKTNSTILIAEAVILGKVPDSYVVVPQDDILDALD